MGACGGKTVEINPHRIDESHFQFIKIIGGFGTVSLVERRQDGKLLVAKRLKKMDILKSKTEYKMLFNERDYMLRVDSPFVLRLLHVYHTEEEVLFILPFMLGGNLGFHMAQIQTLTSKKLKKSHTYKLSAEFAGGTRKAMNEEAVRLIIAEALVGLQAIHEKNILIRDIKPKNILIDAEGHITIADFGLAVDLGKSKDGLAVGQSGTAVYMSPEALQGKRYGKSADVYCLGVTLYELLEGKVPYSGRTFASTLVMSSANSTPEEIERKKKEKQLLEHKDNELISGLSDADRRGRLSLNEELSAEARDLIQKMLEPDVSERLGCGPAGLEEIKSHAWFAGMDWEKVEKKEVAPVFVPDSRSYGMNNFPLYFGMVEAFQNTGFEVNEYREDISEKDQKKFEAITYNVSL